MPAWHYDALSSSSVHLLSLVLLLVFFPSPALVHRPYSSEPRQQLLTCAGRLRMVFVVLGTARWSSDNFYYVFFASYKKNWVRFTFGPRFVEKGRTGPRSGSRFSSNCL
ncbi:hypothetical protein C8R48DRAFT_694678 [Suillus tomentosus]|nr:hypothetical protein C8R48DRAFT_734946 [Suillus tomentosus]KAG1845949.1 hypothetical protein C8R48DRAFT_733491 [Suillus tomentosus]KAG1873479.1 hypothetical protein C8R48DRAFT_694678 [Suillus tomentosus]